MLSGYKTYIFAALLVASQFAEATGIMTPEVTEMVTWIFGGGALAALRAGVAGK